MDSPLKQLIDSAQSDEERKGFERFISMILTIRKHKFLRSIYKM